MSAAANMRLRRVSSANVQAGQVDLVERVAAELDHEADGLEVRGAIPRACDHPVARSRTRKFRKQRAAAWQSERVPAKGRWE